MSNKKVMQAWFNAHQESVAAMIQSLGANLSQDDFTEMFPVIVMEQSEKDIINKYALVYDYLIKDSTNEGISSIYWLGGQPFRIKIQH